MARVSVRSGRACRRAAQAGRRTDRVFSMSLCLCA